MSTNTCTGATEHTGIHHLGTFVEGPASHNVTPVGKAGPPRTEGSVIGCARLGTFIAGGAPGSTH